LWSEAEELVEEKEERLQNIGWELFELYTWKYNGDDNDDKKWVKVVDDYTWDIYDDIYDGMTFKESVKKYLTCINECP